MFVNTLYIQGYSGHRALLAMIDFPTCTAYTNAGSVLKIETAILGENRTET